jgi:membrane protein DedA with SNARE-associated domain
VNPRWLLLAAGLLAFILVPFALWEDAFHAFAASQRSAFWIGALLAADVVLPVPSSLLSTAAGALLGFPLGALVSTIGMTAASATGYWLGASLGHRAARWAGSEPLNQARALCARYGDWAIPMSRPVPVLAEAAAIVAGMIRLPWRRFLLLSALANLGISLAYAAVGAGSKTAGSFLFAFAGAIGLPAFSMWLIRRRTSA